MGCNLHLSFNEDSTPDHHKAYTMQAYAMCNKLEGKLVQLCLLVNDVSAEIVACIESLQFLEAANLDGVNLMTVRHLIA
jgi:hypothetical protein